jgi:exosome complex protein LRP1
MEGLQKELANTKDHLENLWDTPFAELSESLDRREAAKLNVSLAYTLASLYYIQSKAAGNSAQSTDAVTQELARIKTYVAKLASTTGPALRVDSGAAKRMISHQLS